MDEKWPGRERSLNDQLRHLARRGHGVLSPEDLLLLGITRQMIQTRVAAGRLVPVLKRVHALPGAELGFRGRARAAVSSAGPNVFVSHQSALALHGLVTPFGPVHLIGRAGAFRVGGSRKWCSAEFGFSVECHQTRFLPPEHLTEIEGIRVTTTERALRDYAATATPNEITKALTQGEKERTFCWKRLRALVESSNGHKGMGMLQAEINDWEEAFSQSSSNPETDFLRMLRGRRMPMPEVNVRIGEYVLDFLWRHLNLGVELDPYSTHSGLASHRRDHRKSIELETRGLRILRFTGEDVYQHESRTAEELLTVMHQQATILNCPIFPPGSETESAG